jgi:hypothetical protein
VAINPDLDARLTALGAPSRGSGGFGRMFRDFGAGALGQVPSWAVRTARGVSDLATLGHDNPVSGYLTKTLDDYEDWRLGHTPQSTAATVGGIGSEFLLTGAEYVAGGGAIRHGLRKVAPRLSRRSGSLLGEVAKDAISVMPLDAMQAARKETSLASMGAEVLPEGSMAQRAAEKLSGSFTGRLAAEVGFGAAADAALRAAGSGVRVAARSADDASPLVQTLSGHEGHRPYYGPEGKLARDGFGTTRAQDLASSGFVPGEAVGAPRQFHPVRAARKFGVDESLLKPEALADESLSRLDGGFNDVMDTYMAIGLSKDDAARAASDISMRMGPRRETMASMGEIPSERTLRAEQGIYDSAPRQTNPYRLGGGRELGPAPEQSYHTTYNRDKVLEEGLKTGREARTTGLGGTSDMVSVTRDPDVAEGIAASFREVNELLNMPLDRAVTRMMMEARQGAGASKPYMGGWAHADNIPLQQAHRGKIQKVSPVDEVPAGVEIMSTQNFGRDAVYYVDAVDDPDAAAEYLLDLYKGFSMSRDLAGGPMDPLYFGSDPIALRDLDPSQIDVLTVRPRNKDVVGEKVSSMGEWRTWGGRGLKVASEPEFTDIQRLTGDEPSQLGGLRGEGVPAEFTPHPDAVERIGAGRLNKYQAAGARAAGAALGGAALLSDDPEAQAYGTLLAGAAVGVPAKAFGKFGAVSRLEGAVAHAGAKRSAKLPAVQWGKILETSTKAGEMEWTGLRQYLADKGESAVHVDEINGFLEQNGLRLNETVTKGVKRPGQPEDPDALWDTSNAAMDERRVPPPSWDDPISGPPDPAYNLRYKDDLITPGGTDYEEIRVTLDERRPQRVVGQSSYESPHWDERDVLVHLRVHSNEVNGVNATLIDELQSDWHQAGRKEGYRDSQYESKEAKVAKEQVRVAETEYLALRESGLASAGEIEQAASMYQVAVTHLNGVQKLTGAPDGPYKETAEWSLLGIKRAIDRAVDAGQSRVAWVGGGSQAKRYDKYTAANVDRLEATRAFDMEWEVTVYPADGGTPTVSSFDQRELAPTFGESAARRIVNEAPPRFDEDAQIIASKRNNLEGEISALEMHNGGTGNVRNWSSETVDEWRAYKEKLNAMPTAPDPAKGLSIKGSEILGDGQGMVGFYDEILPGVVAKYGKRFGISTNPKRFTMEDGTRGWYFDIDPKLAANVRSGGTTLYSGHAIGSGLVGGLAGSMTDEEGENTGFLMGAAIGAGAPSVAKRFAPAIKRGAAATRKSMSDLVETRQQAKNAAAESPTFGSGDEATLADPATPDAVRRMFGRQHKGGKATRAFREDERLLNLLERARQKISRNVLGIEKTDKIAGGGTAARDAAAEVRGAAAEAELHINQRLGELVRDNEEHLDAGAALLRARRLLELEETFPDKLTDAQIEDAFETIAHFEGNLDVEDSADALQAYYRDLLDMKYNEGLLSNAQYRALRDQGQNYIPFLPAEISQLRDNPLGGSIYAPTNEGLRTMTDKINEAILVNPYEQAIKDTYETYHTVARQRLGNVVAQLTDDSDAMKKFVIPLGKKKPTEPLYGETISVIRGGEKYYYRIEDPDLLDSWTAFTKETSDGLVMRIADSSRRFMQAGVTHNPVFPLRNGIRDYFMSAVQTPLNEGLQKRVPGLTGTKQVAIGAVSGAALKDEDDSYFEGATKGVAFVGAPHMLAHAGRVAGALNDIVGPHNIGMVTGGLAGYMSAEEDDGFTGTMAKVALGAGAGRALGTGALMAGRGGNRQNLNRFHREGGGQFGLYSSTEKDAKRMLQDLLDSGVDRSDIIESKGWGDDIGIIMQPINAMIASAKRTVTPSQQGNVISDAFNAITRAGAAIETAPRLAHFKRTENIFESRDLGLDFAVRGSSKTVNAITKGTPFLNPMIQGVDKLARMVADPATAPIAAATIMAPSLLLWQMNHADPETAAAYSARPEWERNSYWLIPKKILSSLGIGSETEGFYRSPKPFELGYMFASIPERAMDIMAEYDEIGAQLTLAESMGELGDITLGFAGSFMSPSLPLPIGPIMQANAGEHGYDIFGRRPIDPLPWMDIPQSDQQTPYTSSVAMGMLKLPVVSHILIGAGFDSPAKVDFAIRGYTGTLGTEAVRVASEAARNMGWDDRPAAPSRLRYGVRDFQTNDQLVTQHESDFRETFGETQEQWNGLQRKIRENPAAAQAMMQDPELQQAVAMYQMGRGFKNRIDQLTSARRQIRFSSQLDEETKKRMTIELTTAIAGISLTYNQARRKIDRRMEASR